MHQIRTADGRFDGIESLEKYIFEKCAEHKAKKRAFAFALIVYDFSDPYITKILEDDEYFNALDYTSGKYLAVFYVHSEYIRHQSERAKSTNKVRMEFGVQKLDGPVDVSPKFLGEKIINNDSLPSPSVIFFNTSGYVITDYTIAKLRENEIERGFNELLKVIQTAVTSIDKVIEENRANDEEIFNLIKQSIEGSEYWKSAKAGFNKMMKVKDFIFFWKV
jgi:hypothetical protein